MSVAHGGSDHTASRSINQTVALVFGAVYVLVGIIGLFVAKSFAGNGAEQGDILGIFQVNHVHNIVHLLIGVALIVAAKRHDTARNANLAIGAVYIALAVLGPFIAETAIDIVALNSADHVLHALSGIVLVATALAADKTRARTRA